MPISSAPLASLWSKDGPAQGMPGLTRTELERTAREQLAEPPRIALARMVRGASVASETEAEFVRQLRGSGIFVRPRFETGGTEAVIGYSVAMRPRAGDAPIWFGGGKLAKDLTLPSLRQFWSCHRRTVRRLSPSGRRPRRPQERAVVGGARTGSGRSTR